MSIVSVTNLSSCSKKLTAVQNKTAEQIEANYKILKDVPYGTYRDQRMDMYLSKSSKSYGKCNYTVVFLHGGGYYFSDKSEEEHFIEPYLKKGLNVVNMNYQLKKGIPTATSDLTSALNFLQENNSTYNFNLENIIVTGFSAGAHIATNVGVSQNNLEFPNKLHKGISITGIINFSGPVDGLDVVEKNLLESDNELWKKAAKALFPAEGYESKEKIAVYEPISYFDKNDPPIFLWYGGMDDQIPPHTFKNFVSMLNENKDVVMYKPDGLHRPNKAEYEEAYLEIFNFLDNL